MDLKKLILALSFCSLAAFYTFFQQSETKQNALETKNVQKTKVKKTTNENFSQAETLEPTQNLNNEIVIHKKAPSVTETSTGDPYQDLLQKIQNQEVEVTEEQKIESLKNYLDTTVKASELEAVPPSIGASNEIDSGGADRREEAAEDAPADVDLEQDQNNSNEIAELQEQSAESRDREE